MTGTIIAMLLFLFLRQYSFTTIITVLWPTILICVIALVALLYSIFKDP